MLVQSELVLQFVVFKDYFSGLLSFLRPEKWDRASDLSVRHQNLVTIICQDELSLDKVSDFAIFIDTA